MDLHVATSALPALDADVLGFLIDDPASPPKALVALDEALGGALIRELGRSKLKRSTAGSVTVTGGASGPAKVVLVVPGNTGDGAEETRTDAVRSAGAAVAGVARAAKAARVAIELPSDEGDAQAFTEGTILGAFRIHKYRTGIAASSDEPGYSPGDDAPALSNDALSLIIAGGTPATTAAAHRGHVLATAQNWARDLANAPANVLPPVALAHEARELAAKHEHLTCTVLGTDEIEDEGMGLIAAVAQGAHDRPRVIVLEWNPPSAASQSDGDRLALIGKAVTFDTGGISIKPSQGMEGMKLDKSGGCAVIGAMRAIAELDVPRRVIAIIGAAMNMPDGDAYRPGDVYTGKDGTTVEIISTDAEGRLVLADCIALARQHGCGAIVEASTLTGAMVISLGHRFTGAIARPGALIDTVLESAARTGDLAWHLPMHAEYGRNLKTDCADVKNSGGRDGGALSAGAFLQRFAKDTPFVHLDVAGTAMLPKPRTWYGSKGASGWGVRLMADLAERWVAEK